MRDEGFVEFAGAATPSLLGLAWLLTGDREQAQDLGPDGKVIARGEDGDVAHG
ncbi:MAG TPA: hypothetical protein VF657_12515 [Actinoplanes sp.]|jgi:hypothetical protein